MRNNSLLYQLRIISTKPHILNWLKPFLLLQNPQEYLKHLVGFNKRSISTYFFNNGLKFNFRPGTKDTAILLENISAMYTPSQLQLDQNGTVVDIGAHIGAFTILIAKICSNGNVYAFEPEEENYELLESNVVINNLTNVTLGKVAITNKVGDTCLLIDSMNTGMNYCV